MFQLDFFAFRFRFLGPSHFPKMPVFFWTFFASDFFSSHFFFKVPVSHLELFVSRFLGPCHFSKMSLFFLDLFASDFLVPSFLLRCHFFTWSFFFPIVSVPVNFEDVTFFYLFCLRLPPKKINLQRSSRRSPPQKRTEGAAVSFWKPVA